jgi:hypothetical protein
MKVRGRHENTWAHGSKKEMRGGIEREREREREREGGGDAGMYLSFVSAHLYLSLVRM